MFILKNLKENSGQPWCQKMLHRFTLPASVHSHSTYRVWQKRCYDMNIWSERKRLEKLNYMHGNPVKRRLVFQPGDWPWSSWRFYHLGDNSQLSMDRLPEWLTFQGAEMRQFCCPGGSGSSENRTHA